jgi:hypothetical protein
MENINISWCFTVKNRCLAQWRNLRTKKIITLPLFKNCLKSVFEQQRPNETWQISISDWGSSDVNVEDHVNELLQQCSPKGNIIVTVESIDEPGKFSRGKGLNVAADNALYDTLFFLDTDMLLTNRNVVSEIISYVPKQTVYFPKCCKYYDITHTDCWKGPPFGMGMMAISKKLFKEKPGGWKEFYKWGHEDNDIYKFFKKRKQTVRPDPGGFFHQWHPPDNAKKHFSRYKHEDPYEAV